MVGPGKGIDTDKYFIVCSNIIGSCMGSTGPCSTNPKTVQPYALVISGVLASACAAPASATGLAATPVGFSGDVSDITPSSVTGTIQVDPGDQPFPLPVAESDALVALAQHLHQLAGIGVELQGPLDPVVALRAGPADVLLEFFIGLAERLHVVLPQIGQLLPLVRLVGVATDTVLIQNRLHLAVEAEPPRGIVELR